jgi:hypothetical protein
MEATPDEETINYIAQRRLQNRYADIVTRRAWPELGEIFHPDCTLDLSLGDRSAQFVGPKAVGTFIGESVERFSFFQFVVLNTVFEIRSSENKAVARMYIHELRVERATGKRTDAYGVYHDRFVRDENSGWRFIERHYGSFSRTAPAESREDQVVFPLPERDLAAWIAES